MLHGILYVVLVVVLAPAAAAVVPRLCTRIRADKMPHRSQKLWAIVGAIGEPCYRRLDSLVVYTPFTLSRLRPRLQSWCETRSYRGDLNRTQHESRLSWQS